jgi:starch phosphorylase
MLTPEQARIHQFKVVPALPEPLQPLMEIARNLWWTWHPEAIDLFMRLDRQLWQSSGHNPVKMLGSCPQDLLERTARDEAYLACLQRVHERLSNHLTRPTWFSRQVEESSDCCIAYFSAEFGLTECLQSYSGGLGVLAGDHLKSASELGLPLVGVGLLYRNGYFQQYLNADGWQQEQLQNLDFANLPITPIENESGEQLTVEVLLAGRRVKVAVWQATVGRIRLFLLDTNRLDNEPADRAITAQLYGGDMDMRIRQEIVLGIGGVHALAAMGIEPTVMHLNEGHAAFLALERIRRHIAKHDVSFDEARTACAAGHVFTTHTPVPAGIDRFPAEMIQRYFKDYHPQLRLDIEGLLALGRENVFNKSEFFSMAVLALRTSDSANGVSRLHGRISREMWHNIWPNVPAEEIPIGHVTNGVHTRSWLSPQMVRLFDRYLSLRWQTDPEDQSVWQGVSRIPDEELWRTREERRQRLVTWVRRTLQAQLARRGASTAEIEQAGEALDHRTLTIGFARRFATYKRANLLFRDPQRLLKLLSDPKRPMQIVIAGKAHPADTQGKELIRQIIHFARETGSTRRVVFVENYDICVARYLVQGVDVWLNTPRRGMEASGTSGMKAAMNGVLNCSVLDGWWDEAYAKDLGWAIGHGEVYANYDYQDQVESQAMYDLLEKHIVPLFYDREEDGLPRQWCGWIKKSMQSLVPRFNTNRMVQDYTEQYYIPAHVRAVELSKQNYEGAAELAHYAGEMRGNWNEIRVETIEADTARPLGVREPMGVTSVVYLGPIRPEHVRVQLYCGQVDAEGRIPQGNAVNMTLEEDLGEGRYRYRGQLSAGNSGQYGFAVRVIPGHKLMATPFVPGLISWDRHVARAKESESVPARA